MNRQIEVIEWDLVGRVEAVFVAPYLYVSKACLDSREEIVSWARSLLESGETEAILRKDHRQIQEGVSPER